jgi:hypothetical protein
MCEAPEAAEALLVTLALGAMLVAAFFLPSCLVWHLSNAA